MTPPATARGALRVGTRGSPLARAQTESLRAALEQSTSSSVEIVVIATAGDRSAESFATIGGTGIFASALREALVAGECDVVVHSLKDLPTGAYPGLSIAAVVERADPRDVVCARDGLTLETLPPGAKVGTGSPRRAAQLRARRSDLTVVDLRGNVDSRLRRIVPGDLDALILAAAGLLRLGRASEITEYLSLDDWPVAPGQGALALETREGEEHLVAALDDRDSRTMVDSEREVLRLLEAGCSAPIGTQSIIDDGLLFLTARVYRPDGSESISSSHAIALEGGESDSAEAPAFEVAGRVADELLALGAADFAPLGRPKPSPEGQITP